MKICLILVLFICSPSNDSQSNKIITKIIDMSSLCGILKFTTIAEFKISERHFISDFSVEKGYKIQFNK